MANVIGTVDRLEGKFYAKDSQGNMRELKNTDKVYEGEIIVPDTGNISSEKIIIALADQSGFLHINSTKEQLLDKTLLNEGLNNEELAFNPEDIQNVLVLNNTNPQTEEAKFAQLDGAQTDINSDLRQKQFGGDDSDYKQETKDIQESRFAALDGSITDVNSDLKQASWPGIMDYEQIQNADIVNSINVGSTFAIRDGDSTDIVSDLRQAEWFAPIEEPTYKGEVENINNNFIDLPPIPQTIIKVIAADASGQPLVDSFGNYTGLNETAEGGHTYYIALAFKPGTTVFNDTTKLATQNGTVDLTFTNGTATTNNYIPPAGLTNITLGTKITANALDDYIADNGEKFTVTISNYTPVASSTYGATTINNLGVTTTITDNSKPVGVTPHNPNDTPTHTTEGNKEIVMIKLFAADENGDVIKDGSGIYQLANIVDEVERIKAKYIAYAFNDGETTFSDATKLTTQVGQVNVEFTDGTAAGINATTLTNTDGTQDYNKTPQTIQIGQSFSTEIFKDLAADGGQTYTVKLLDNTYASYNGSSYESVNTDNTAVTTTIKERLFAKIEVVNVGDNVANEGGNLTYTITIVDENGTAIAVTSNATVHLNYEGLSAHPATKTTDYTAQDTVIVASGDSTKTFTLPALDDYFAEGDEKLKITITEIDYNNNNFSIKPHTIANGASGDKVVVDGTIKDNPADVKKPVSATGEDVPGGTATYGQEDTVYVKIIGSPTVVEGNDLVHHVQLVDKDGNKVIIPDGQSITVTLTYTTTTGPLNSSDFKDGLNKYTENSTITVTLDKNTPVDANGVYKLPITNTTKDDFTADNNEAYTLTITNISQSGAFENIAIGDASGNNTSVTGTILDGVTFGTPVNAIVLEDGLNTAATDNITVTVGGSNYTTPVGTSENDLGKSLGITNPNTDTYAVSFDKTITTTDKTSNGKAITYSYNEAGTLLTATRAGDSKVVFTVELKKDGTNDVYDFKLKEPMDHVYGNNSKNTFDMPFKFNVTSNGTTSTNQTFNVTVVDSVPNATPIITTTKEDTPITIRLADDDFKAGETVTINGAPHNVGATGIAIYEQGNTTKQIGSLTINSNGTVTFTPVEDYSNHDTAKSPQFSYTVKDLDGDEATSTVTINVKPVADTITITTSTLEMIEDNTNANEGASQVALGLTTPAVSKDQTDKNFSAGDHSERNGEITLTFTNGDKITGAKIFNGATQVGSDISTANQELKIVIVTTSGDSNTIDYTYHHADITASKPSGAIYLTQAEYQALKIQHAEDNDTNINIKIGVTSYELDDSDKPLNATTSTYTDKTNTDLSKTTEATMTVKINPTTDKFSLNWDGTNNAQVNSVNTTTKTVVFNNLQEYNPNPVSGSPVDTSIDLNALLTPTSGTSTVGNTETKLDLDGSEKRSYTIKLTETNGKDLPDYIYITIGNKTDVKAYKNASDEYTVAFDDAANKTEDPAFSMKFPDYWSGTVTGTITLKSQDKGVDTTDAAGDVESDSVNFTVTVEPVANIATIQVAQAVGFEDAGRDGGNTDAKSDTINANGTGGIPLAIKVSSDDKDNSEKFDVTISAIPADAVIYYGGVLQAQTGNSITIVDFDNATSLVIVPPHNSDADFTLNVSAVTTDGASTSGTSNTTIDVIVKNVADAPVGTELNTGINVNEDNQLNLQSLYTTPASLASYDATEVLTVKIELPTGFTIDSGSPFYIDNGLYVVKASDITAGNIKLVTPTNFSGNADIKLTYVTTEKAGEGDSKTWNTQTVSIFVNPIADDVTVTASSTINEDADGSANKIDLKPTLSDADTKGVETITSVKILASSVASGYELFLGSANGTSIASKLVGLYYELTPAEADSVYAKNTTAHDADNVDSFPLTVVYTVKDTNGSLTDTKDFTHTHTVNVKAVTDAPTLTLGTISEVSGDVTISGSNVTIVNENSEFKVPVTTTSNDKDSSETVTKIVISGVPMGVEVVGGTYYGYSGSVHNGIWEILAPADSTLDANGALSDIVFKVTTGADFEERDIKITTYTQDGTGAEVKNASQTIHINAFDAPSTGPGNPPLFNLSTKAATIYEDNNEGTSAVIYNLGKSINVANGGGSASGNYAITFTDFPEGTTVAGASYSYEEGGKTYYVVTGTGNASDVETKLSTVIVTPPTDMNTGGAKDGQMTFSATISTFDGGTFKEGMGISPAYAETIIPVTDAMTVAVTADNINEDGTSNLSITLTNPSDDTKTELVGNSLTITVTETWADAATGGGTKGTLSGTGYIITESPIGTYTITKTDGTPFPIGSAITGLQYTPASNRDGSVKFDVSVKNIEGTSITLDSTGDKTITVNPVVDVVLNASVVTATGTEDTAFIYGGVTLANPVKLEITAGTFADGSESLGNIVLDEVPNGFTVWYKDGANLVMATNIGTTTGTAFDLTPNISGDANAARNKWLVPVSGALPEIYVNAPTNWSGDFDFDAHFIIKEENLSSTTSQEVQVTGHIDSVADTMTIAPTLTFGDAFSWIDLKLNANMVDVDGSETMSLKITGLDDMAQFQLANGTAVNAVHDGTSTWTLNGVTYDQINNIQFVHDKPVTSVSVVANTVEIGNTTEGATASATFELKLSDVAGTFKLDAGLSLDFSKIDSINTLKNIESIDLTANGDHNITNVKLSDVISMTDSNKNLTIIADAGDSVTFKNDGTNEWSTTGDSDVNGFKDYINTGDPTVTLKISDEATVSIAL